MVKVTRKLIFFLFLLMGTLCFADGEGIEAIKKLPIEWHYRLSGVWGPQKDLQPEEDWLKMRLSWGVVQCEPGNRIIDLNAPTPFIRMEGGYFRVTGFQIFDAGNILLRIEVIASDVTGGDIVIHLYKNGTIRFEDHLIPRNVIGFDFDDTLYRYFGPKPS